MALTKPPVLPPWADAGDKIQPSNAEIQAGWPLSSIPPSRQRFNWLLNFLSNGVRYFSRRGLPDYDAAETYMIGDRIIGDDGKTYRSLVDNNTAQTPSTSPTKWGRWGFTFDEFLAGVTTPPQFDNDTSLATTAFVQRALGNFSGWSPFTTSGAAIPAAAVGKAIQVHLGADGFVYLPRVAQCVDGAALTIINTSHTTKCSLSVQAPDVLTLPNITLLPGESVEVIASTLVNSWFVNACGGALGKTAGFAASLATSGYQKLPSGLIIQWGRTPQSSGSIDASGTWPIAFPTAFLSASFLPDRTAGDLGVFATMGAVNKTNYGYSAWTATGSRVASVGSWFIAIGY